MTQAEFADAYYRARATYNKLTREVLEKLKAVYTEAAARAAQQVIMADLKGLSSLTVDSWRRIQAVLEDSSAKIAERLDSELRKAIASGGDRVLSITENYLDDLIEESGERLTRFGVSNMFVGVSNSFVESMVNRLSVNGYTFSQRVWRVGQDIQLTIKNVIETGMAMGRDAVDIARDLQVYVKLGRRGLARRYGALERGTIEWARRIRKDIDYNALRLIRSEMYQSLQDASARSALMNPASTGMVIWIRNTSEDWNCLCPSLAAGSPYPVDQVPAYPHPNCLCTIQPQLRDLRVFSSDLRAWARGEEVGYMDTWYQQQYLRMA